MSTIQGPIDVGTLSFSVLAGWLLILHIVPAWPARVRFRHGHIFVILDHGPGGFLPGGSFSGGTHGGFIPRTSLLPLETVHTVWMSDRDVLPSSSDSLCVFLCERRQDARLDLVFVVLNQTGTQDIVLWFPRVVPMAIALPLDQVEDLSLTTSLPQDAFYTINIGTLVTAITVLCRCILIHLLIAMDPRSTNDARMCLLATRGHGRWMSRRALGANSRPELDRKAQAKPCPKAPRPLHVDN